MLLFRDTVYISLIWKDRTAKIQKQQLPFTAVIYRIRNALSIEEKVIVYKALVVSVIRCDILAYGPAPDCHLS